MSYRECQTIQESTIGKQHPDYIDGQLNIGQCFVSMQDFDAAAEVFSECRQSMQDTGRSRSRTLRYARTCYGLGECL